MAIISVERVKDGRGRNIRGVIWTLIMPTKHDSIMSPPFHNPLVVASNPIAIYYRFVKEIVYLPVEMENCKTRYTSLSKI